VDTGEALVSGPLEVELGRLGARARAGKIMLVAVERSKASVAALQGVGLITKGDLDGGGTDGGWVALAPGQQIIVDASGVSRPSSVAIARLISRFEDEERGMSSTRQATRGVRGPAAPVTTGGKVDAQAPAADGLSGKVIEAAAAATVVKGREAAQGSARAREFAPPRPVAAEVELPLRDRVLALEGPSNRLFYLRKRDLVEAQHLLESTSRPKSEPDRLVRYRRRRMVARADRLMAEHARTKEETFERRVLLPDVGRDAQVGPKREWIHGMGLWLLTRNQVAQVRRLATARRAEADALTVRIQAARLSGEPSERIAQLERARQGALDSAMAETERLVELVRLMDEPAP
jgi:hypothetical protein